MPLEIEEVKRYNIGIQNKKNHGSSTLSAFEARLNTKDSCSKSDNLANQVGKISFSFKTAEKKVLEAIVEESLPHEDDEMGGTVASPRDFQSSGDLSKKRNRIISSDMSPGILDSDVADEESNLLSLGSP
jgi:hypothetical protein